MLVWDSGIVSFTILGIKFRDDGPGIEYWRRYADRKINIILSTSAGARHVAGMFFKWHMKRFHLLAPVRIEDATNLEEGVACYFSLVYMEKKRIEPKLYYDMKSYKHVLKIRPRPDLKRTNTAFADYAIVSRHSEISVKKKIRREFPKRTEEDVCFFSHQSLYGRRLTNSDRRIHSLDENEGSVWVSLEVTEGEL